METMLQNLTLKKWGYVSDISNNEKSKIDMA